MSEQVVTKQKPRHAFGVEPRHELVFTPDFRELNLCGHMFEEGGESRICILPAEEHEGFQGRSDADRVRLLGFALQQIIKVESDVKLIHTLARVALKEAEETP